MTGQGNRFYEASKRSKDRCYIHVDRTYRTRCGYLVRGLHLKNVNKVKRKDGTPLEIASVRTLIIGQVWMTSPLTGTKEWMERAWTDYGDDLLNTELDLVEYKEKKPAQPTLFG